MTGYPFRLPPGPVDLASIDTNTSPGFKGGKKKGKAALFALGDDLSDLQERLFAEGRSGSGRRLLLVLQGTDTSGKGGVLRHTVGLVDPQGVRITSFKAAHRGGARPRLPLADPQGAPRGGLHRRLRPVPLRGRPDRTRPRAGRPRGDRATLHRDQRLRARARRRRHDRSEVHAAHLAGGPEGAPPRAARQAEQALEVQPLRHRRARRSGRATARPTRSRWSGPTPSTPRGTSSRAGRSGTGTSRSAGCSTTPSTGWTRSGRPRTTTWTSNAGGSSTRRPSRDRHRLRHALRHPAARGRAACPASSRPTTSAPTSASSGAPVRGCGCWSPRWSWASSPAGSACRRPGSWRSTWTRRSPATRPTRRSRTCSTPARD